MIRKCIGLLGRAGGIMLILNPTENDLKSWYKCNHIIANYLLEKGLPVIHIDKKNKYFFVKTNLFKEVYKNIPLWMRVFELF